MKIHFNYFYFLLLLSLPLYAANTKITEKDFSNLCHVYERYLDSKETPAMIALLMSEEMQAKVPSLSYHLGMIFNMDPSDDRYLVLRRISKYETGKDWNCKAAKEFLSRVTIQNQ